MKEASKKAFVPLEQKYDSLAKKIRSFEERERKASCDEAREEKERSIHRTVAETLREIMQDLGIAAREELQDFYVTFGSEHPYQRGQYVLVREQDYHAACRRYRAAYPHPSGESTLFCADIYPERYFMEHLAKGYPAEPAEIIEG